MEYGFNRKLYPTQEKFIADAINLIENGKNGIFSSPTGTGKTLSLLCVASKFMKPDDDDDLFSIMNSTSKTKVFYCSRTHSQLAQAINELKSNKNKYNAIILGSRKIYCINKEVNKFTNIDIINDNCKNFISNEKCQFYKNFHYDQRILDIEDLTKLGLEKTFCPYYYSKNKSDECDIVFLPYNLLFDPKIRNSLNIDLKDKILIIDEAHNIYDTVIEINSATIRWDEIMKISKIKGLSEDLKNILKKLIDFHMKIKIEKAYKIVDFLINLDLSDFNMIEMSEFLDKNKMAQKNDMKSIFEFSKFLNLLTFSDDFGRIFVDKYKIRFTCMNPKMYFDDLKACKSIILAGGTMEPITNIQNIFKDIDYFTYPPINNNFLPLIITHTSNNKNVNLNFSERDEQIDDVVNSLIALTNPILSGGILIFLPSKYFILKIKQSEKIKYFRRSIYFDDEIKLDVFKLNPGILISVMGGSLSEGINFSDDMCRLLIIVGVPYSTKNLEFDERSKYNRDYGSMIAIKTVNQTIGRAKRHKNDYAAIILLDIRYANLKDKLSPWISKKIKICKFLNGLLEINQFLKSQNENLDN